MSGDQPWQHGGDRTRLAAGAGIDKAALLDLSANMNPLGPPAWLREVVDGQVSELCHYPDPHHRGLNQALTERYGLDPARVVWGNGASQLLYALARVLPGSKALIPVPCYSDYARAFQQAGFQVSAPAV